MTKRISSSLLLLLLSWPIGINIFADDCLIQEEDNHFFKQAFQKLFTKNIHRYLRPYRQDQKNFNSLEERNQYYQNLLSHSLYTSPHSTEEMYNHIVFENPKAEEKFKTRNELFQFDPEQINHQVFFNLKNCPQSTKEHTKYLLRASKQPDLTKIPLPSSFSLDPEILQSLNDTIMILVPGFGGHLIEDAIFSDLVKMVNLHHGRAERKAAKVFEEHTEYYQTYKGGFDILFPAGFHEIGNTFASDKDSAERMFHWIDTLPAHYQDKKIILLGYSKGAPVAQELLFRYPEIAKRTWAFITLAGVVQGALSTTNSMRLVDTMEKFYYQHKDGAINASNWHDILSPNIMMALLQSGAFLEILKHHPSTANYYSVIEENVREFQSQIDEHFFEEMRAGIKDMTNLERTKKNFKYWPEIDQSLQSSDHKLMVFSLSALTQKKDWVIPLNNTNAPSTHWPFFNQLKKLDRSLIEKENIKNIVDWKYLSLDNIFLDLSSIQGMREAPGGLFDCQVAFMDSKAVASDHRPLAETLDTQDLTNFQQEFPQYSSEELQQTPRKKLFPALKNVHFYELADLRGHHWSIALDQVFRPKILGVENYYIHHFPRLAESISLLQVLGLAKSVADKN